MRALFCIARPNSKGGPLWTVRTMARPCRRWARVSRRSRARCRQDSCALSDSPIGPPPVRPLFQQRHVQVAPRSPLAFRDILEPRGDEHEGRLPVREGAHHVGPPSDLAVEALDGVVGSDAAPVLARETGVRQGLGKALAHDSGSLPEPHPLELARDRERLGIGGAARLHRVDRPMLRWIRAWPISNMLLVSTTRIIPRRAVPSLLSGRHPTVKVLK